MRTLLLRLFVVSSLVMSGAQALAAYKVTALDSLGDSGSLAAGINNSNVVVGTSINGDLFPRSVTWTGTGTAPVDVRPGDWLSWGKAINDAGHVAGTYGSTYGRFPTGSAYASPHSDSSIGSLGASDSAANDINNNGVAVGYAYTQGWAGEPLYPFEFYGTHAAMWNGTTSVDLHPASAGGSQANAINDAGVIVGSVDSNAVMWNNGTVTTLGQGSAIDINNNGVIAGSVDDYAVIWNGTTQTILGQGSASAINIVSQVVGSSGGHAFLWDNGNAIDLNNFLSLTLRNAGWILEQAVGINDLGWIVANAYNIHTMTFQPFVLSPAPEPSTYLMMVLGLAWLGWRARVRNKAGKVDDGMLAT